MNFRALICRTSAVLGLWVAFALAAPAQPAPQAPAKTETGSSTVSYVTKMADRLQGYQFEGGVVAYALPAAPDGALRVVPYFSNLAALGWVEAARATDDAAKRESWLKSTRDWMNWYAAHMNPDGTIYDFTGPAKALKATGTYDSTDSYGATFALLAWRYLELTQDLATIKTLTPALKQARASIDLTRDEDGMTFATPLYGFKYLMDNCEVAIGLAAMGRLFEAVGDNAAAQDCKVQLLQLRSAFAKFYSPKMGVFGYAMDAFPYPLCGFSEPYPDAMANLMLLTWVASCDQKPARELFDRLWREFWIARPASRDFPTWWAWAAAKCGQPQAEAEAVAELQKRAAAPDADCVLVGMAAVTVASSTRALNFPELAFDWATLTRQPERPTVTPSSASASLPARTRFVLTGHKVSSPRSHDGGWLGEWNGQYTLPYQLLKPESYVQINLVFPGQADLSAWRGVNLQVHDLWQGGAPRRLELTLIEADGDWWSAEISNALTARAELTIPFDQLKRSEWGKRGDGQLDLKSILGLRLSLAAQDGVGHGVLSVQRLKLAK